MATRIISLLELQIDRMGPTGAKRSSSAGVQTLERRGPAGHQPQKKLKIYLTINVMCVFSKWNIHPHNNSSVNQSSLYTSSTLWNLNSLFSPRPAKSSGSRQLECCLTAKETTQIQCNVRVSRILGEVKKNNRHESGIMTPASDTEDEFLRGFQIFQVTRQRCERATPPLW